MQLATIPIHKYWGKKFLTLLFTEMMQNSLVTVFTSQWNFTGAFLKKPMVVTWVMMLLKIQDMNEKSKILIWFFGVYCHI